MGLRESTTLTTVSSNGLLNYRCGDLLDIADEMCVVVDATSTRMTFRRLRWYARAIAVAWAWWLDQWRTLLAALADVCDG